MFQTFKAGSLTGRRLFFGLGHPVIASRSEAVQSRSALQLPDRFAYASHDDCRLYAASFPTRPANLSMNACRNARVASIVTVSASSTSPSFQVMNIWPPITSAP